MSHILFLVNHDIVIYNFRLELVERLLADGHRVTISSPYGERIDDLKRLGAEYREIDISRHGMNPLNEFVLISTYKELLNEVKPDIVFSYTIKPNIYGAIACRRKKIPCIANITGLGIAVESFGFKQILSILLYKYAFTKVKTVFFQNQENQRFFVKYKIAIGKHKMLPGSGVNLERFQALPYPGDDVIKFVFIARIMKEKGIDYYLEAARTIKKKHPNTEFHVCGFIEKEYKGKLQEYADRGIVIYHGMVRDIKEIHMQMHCTVFPSYYPEGLSNVLLEAAASARAIITTNRAGCRETVDDGVSGILIPIKNQVALNNAIEKFISMNTIERMTMGLAGRKKVENEFDRQIVIDKYLEELREV